MKKLFLCMLLAALPVIVKAQSLTHLKSQVDTYALHRPVPLSVGQLQTLAWIADLCDSVADTLGAYLTEADTSFLVTTTYMHAHALLIGGNNQAYGFHFGTQHNYPDSNLVNAGTGKILGAITDTSGDVLLMNKLTGTTSKKYSLLINDTVQQGGTAEAGGIAIYKTTDSETLAGYDMLDFYNDSLLQFAVTETGQMICGNVFCDDVTGLSAQFSGTVIVAAITYTNAAAANISLVYTGTTIGRNMTDAFPVLMINQEDTSATGDICQFTVHDSVFTTIQKSGSILLNKPGSKIKITTGANASAGKVTLSSGAATVNTSAVSSASLIFITAQGCSSCGYYYISGIVPGNSFSITSSSGGDASTIAWWIIN